MGKDTYILDRNREEALRRLRGIERLEDPATIAWLERIGVREGWHCLEAGAGAGSIARWLDRRVGPEGRVVAADMQTDLLEAAGAGRAEIRHLDLAIDPVEESAFDLVHERNVLVHVEEREEALEKLARAVRPGGWILVEEPDMVADGPDPTAPEAQRELYSRATAAVFTFLGEMGLDLHFGGRLYGHLRRLGFTSVEAEGIAVTFQGGRPEHRSPHGDAFAELRDQVVTRGEVSAGEFDDFLALYDNPEFAWREGLRMIVCGRRP